MALTREQVINGAFADLEELSLPHPAIPLLRLFILEALDREAAASYVQSRISSTEEAHRLASDWVYVVEAVSRNGTMPQAPDASVGRYIFGRDGGACCVSGLRGRFWDPLIVAAVLPIPVDWLRDQDRTIPMLSAFFGAPYLNWWLDYISEPSSIMPEENHWLVRRSVAQALKAGRVRLDRVQPSMTEYEVHPVIIDTEKPIKIQGYLALLGDHSRYGIAKVDPRFIGSHARFSKSIQLVNLAREIAPSLFDSCPPPHPVPQAPAQRPIRPWARGLQLTSLITTPLFRIWLLFPQRLRLLAYERLRRVGAYLYGFTGGHASVQKLPFGLFLKYDSSECAENEFNALQTVTRHTTVTVPKALDLVSEVVESDDGWGSVRTSRRNYLLTTELPGVPLSQCIDAIPDDDYQQIRLQLVDAVSQLRRIPKTVNPTMAICNTLGEACRDNRIRDFTPIGPFADEAAFSQHLRFSDEPSRRGHRVVFTHGDLNPRNILVDRLRGGGWAVVGIVDWETAGYYPEYWDCTKSLFEGFRWPRRHNDVMRGVFAALGDYTAELDVERRSWESGDGV